MPTPVRTQGTISKQWDCVRENDQNTEKRRQHPAAVCCSCCISPLAQQASAFFSHTSTDRKQMRGNYNGIRRKRKKKESSVNVGNLFWGFDNLIPRLTFFMPLDFINGRKITVTDCKDCKNSFCIPVEVLHFQWLSRISGSSTGGLTQQKAHSVILYPRMFEWIKPFGLITGK